MGSPAGRSGPARSASAGGRARADGRACGCCGSRGPVVIASRGAAPRGGLLRTKPEKREVERARSSYTYGARRAKAGVGGVDLTVGLGADHPVLAMRRCGYDEREPVKEGSERAATAALSRDLQCAFGAERDTTTRG